MVNAITDHIDIWTSAVTLETNGGRGRGNHSNGQNSHGIKKLRELILQLAVMGKLVPQDPNDEPASVLLEKIAKEKKRLIKAGKIKKQKLWPEITKDEKIFELPDGWKWARLGDLCDIKGGKRLPKGHSFSLVETPYIYIQVTNMKNGTIERNNLKYITEITQSEISKYFISKDDLYITIAGTIGDVGIVPDFFDGMNLTENAAKIIFKYLDKSWLQKVLSSRIIQCQFKEKTNQLAQPKLALHRISSSCITVPPLSEQHRIAAKVDELMALCDQLEKQQTESTSIHQTLVETLLDALVRTTNPVDFAETWQRIADHFDILFTTEQSVEQLKQTILQLAVMGKLVSQNTNDEPASVLLEKIAKEKKRLIKAGKIKKQKPLSEIREDEKPFELPDNWEWCRLNDLILESPRNGYSPKTVDYPTATKSLKLSATTSGIFIDTEIKYIDEKIDKDSYLWLEPADILIQRSNSIEYVGVSAVYDGEPHRFIYPDLMMKIKPALLVKSRFLHIALSSSYCREYFRKSASGSQNSMPKINQLIVSNTLIPLCSVNEQKRIIAKLDELMGICNTLKNNLKDIHTIQIQLANAIVEQAVA